MLLHSESDILSQTTFPCRLKEIRSLLGKDASGIVQNRIMFDLSMRVSHTLISYPPGAYRIGVISANLQIFLSISSRPFWDNRQDDDRTISQPVFWTMR